MTESQHISLKHPVSHNDYSSFQSHNSDASSPGQKQQASKAQRPLVPLKLYEGNGNIRSKQPTARGTNIDITI